MCYALYRGGETNESSNTTAAIRLYNYTLYIIYSVKSILPVCVRVFICFGHNYADRCPAFVCVSRQDPITHRAHKGTRPQDRLSAGPSGMTRSVTYIKVSRGGD